MQVTVLGAIGVEIDGEVNLGGPTPTTAPPFAASGLSSTAPVSWMQRLKRVFEAAPLHAPLPGAGTQR